MPKKKSPLTPALIMEKLEALYALSLSQENLTVALRVTELQARSLGLFRPETLPSLSNLSDENLQKLIRQLESNMGSI